MGKLNSKQINQCNPCEESSPKMDGKPVLFFYFNSTLGQHHSHIIKNLNLQTQ